MKAVQIGGFKLRLFEIEALTAVAVDGLTCFEFWDLNSGI